METSTYLTAVVEQTGTFAEWVNGKQPNTAVPTCPKWTLADLVNHVGGTQREMALLVSERMTDPTKAFASYEPGPTDPALWGEWLNESATQAKLAFETVTDDTPVWDPSGGSAGVRFWSRRLFGEACVHRADAAAALGKQYELAPQLAVEALQDWLDTMTSETYWENKADYAEAMSGSGQTLHFHATDAAGEWLVRREQDGIVLEQSHAKADVAVRGPATDLLLVITRRRPLGETSSLEVLGDPELFDHWVDHMDWTTD